MLPEWFLKLADSIGYLQFITIQRIRFPLFLVLTMQLMVFCISDDSPVTFLNNPAAAAGISIAPFHRSRTNESEMSEERR